MIKNKKKEIEKNEKQIYTYKPKMCKGSKKYNKSKKEDFFERQKNFKEKKTQKEEKLKETLKKQQEDELKENNILLKKNEEKKNDSERNKVNVKKTIKGLFKWEEQRKKKIEDKKKEEKEKIETDYDYIPKIDEKSNKLAEKNQLKIKEPNVFERLAAHDQILKGKKKILIEMYTPTFKPQSYVPRNINLEKLKKKNYMSQRENQIGENEEEEEEEEEEDDRRHRKRKKHKKYQNSDEEEVEEIDEQEEEEEEDKGEEEIQEEEDDFDFQQDTMKYADDDVQNALRKSLFNKRKKNSKN